ncbi:MAG: heme-binding protein [Myxococcaceae bacterium]|nr:heme-binding protein [Myxococcaceae bacterium]
MAIETPKYTLVEKRGDVELREYPASVVAETEVEGEQTDAGNEAFSRLAGYIFGKNSGAAKIAMTAPVTQAPAAGTRIAMTAPVTQQASGAKRWHVQFMMPSAWTLDSLPAPSDARVHLRAVPPRKVAAIRYSGTWSQANYREHLEKLQAGLALQGLVAKGDPIWARYDPPWTPWFLRTNEILVEVDAPQAR